MSRTSSNADSNEPDQTALENITQQLLDLQLERDQLREEVATLTEQLTRERRRTSELLTVPTATAEVVPDNSSATVAQRNSKEAVDTFIPPPLPYRLDSQRNRIYPGDRVSFSTPTRFNSTGGVIAYFTPHQVTVKDRTGRKISKDAHNLTLVRPADNNE